MNPLRSSSLRFVAWIGLVFVSLRPIGLVDGAFDVAILPARALAELAPPVSWLSASEVRAAEKQVAERADAESEQGRQLHGDLVALAMPTVSALRDRWLARADVLRYLPGDRDRVEVKLFDAGGVRPDCPVVSGDAYVGRIEELDHGTCVAIVKLVTARDAYVGARLQRDGAARDASVRMIVGGVDRRGVVRSGQTRLVVHNPSQRRLAPGLVVVDELATGLDPLARLANGFALGRVALGDDGEPLTDPALVVPELDYKGGLFQVMVVLDPDTPGGAGSGCLQEGLEDHRWVRARGLSDGDPSAWRAGLVVDRGREAGVRAGAALVSGARLLGRVARAGAWRSDVRLLGDPGLVVTAAARVDGVAAPQILGELVSLGRDPTDGAVLLRWSAAVPIAAGASGSEVVQATLYTGSGESGLPPGLVIGRAQLPTGEAEVSVLRLERDVDPFLLRDLWLRVDEPRESTR